MAGRYLVVVLVPRNVNGNSFTENGWTMASAEETNWVTIPGTTVTLQLHQGQPTQILRAFAADYNAFVEPLRDPDSASWTPSNSVLGQPGENNGSNHLGGTAMDLNWNTHPFQVDYAGFSPSQIATARELLDFYEQTVFWGQDWNTPKDAMHWQMGYNTYQNPHTADFIARKVRADGFSTFRRGSESPTSSAASVLATATGLSVDRATEILSPVREGLQAASCTTVDRIAMWLAQIGHESGSFVYTEEIASGAAYEGRTDLGNTQPGDGVRFKGRTWIQVTGRSNYAAFSRWANTNGIAPSVGFFVENPTKLAELQYAGVGAAWYWTVARSDINALSDQGDLYTVTLRINGGTNGLADRRDRYNRALLQGDALLQLLTAEEDDMFTEADRNLLRQVAEVRRKSVSPLRWPYEGEVNTCAGFAWAADGNIHVVATERLAVTYGDPMSIVLLYAVAHTDEPGRDNDVKLAQRILAKVSPEFYAAAEDHVERWLAAEASHNAA